MGYAFVLGRNSDLSIAELGSFFGKLEIAKSRCVAFVEKLPAAFLKPQDFLNRLGGCIEILEIINRNLPIFEIEAALEKLLKSNRGAWHGKCKFSIDLLPERKSSKLQKMLLINMKKRIGSASFLNKDYKNVSDVAASKERLVERGTKVAVIEEGDGRVSIGVSRAIQDFAAYAKRDYGKPFRDPKAGMLPPKLAQIMLNLAVIASANSVIASPSVIASEAKQSSKIFDPFCGTGTILMEAMLMGYSVMGSDKDARMVSGTKKNLDWLRKNFNVPESVTSEISVADATVIASTFAPLSVNSAKQSSIVIATEPHLGPPLSQFPAQNFLDNLITKLSELYISFFKNIAAHFPKGTPVVFIFPYWKRDKSAVQKLNVIEKIESLGFTATAIGKYDRPNSIVGREIVRLLRME